MLGRLLALFLLTPVVELALLVKLGDLIGFWPTVGLILVTGLTGTYLARREGLSVWRRFNERLGSGALPGRELLDGVIILVAGALLITPGVLTDVVGFVGLLPPTRALIRRHLQKRIDRSVARGTMRFGFSTFGGPPGAPDEASSAWRGEAEPRPQHRTNPESEKAPPRTSPPADR